jgi:hypothetical protein
MLKKIIVVALLEAGCAMGLILFWGTFILSQNTIDPSRAVFYAFERAFIFPDMFYLLPCLILGAVGLWRRKNYGMYFSLLAASAVLFLALLDLTFNIQQKNYLFNSLDSIMFFVMHITLLVGAILGLVLLGFLSNNKVMR